MKSILIALVMASSPAFAQNQMMSAHDEPVVDYISWCDGNKVMGQDTAGNMYVRRVCEETHEECRTTSRYSMHRVIVTATCVDAPIHM